MQCDVEETMMKRMWKRCEKGCGRCGRDSDRRSGIRDEYGVGEMVLGGSRRDNEKGVRDMLTGGVEQAMKAVWKRW